MKKILMLSVLLSSLTACALPTSPVDSLSAKPIDPARVLAYQEPNKDYAKVQIIRDKGFLASCCYIGVMYRQTVLARFDVGEKAEFYLPEGDWQFAIVSDPQGRALCGLSGNPVFETQQIRKDKDNLFRISFGPYRRPRLLPM